MALPVKAAKPNSNGVEFIYDSITGIRVIQLPDTSAAPEKNRSGKNHFYTAPQYDRIEVVGSDPAFYNDSDSYYATVSGGGEFFAPKVDVDADGKIDIIPTA